MIYTINTDLSHSAKGSTWKDHKYIKKENGRYYYKNETTKGGGEIIENPLLDEEYMNSTKYKKTIDSDGNVVWVPTDKRVRDDSSFVDYIGQLIRGTIDQAKVNMGRDKTELAITELYKKKR